MWHDKVIAICCYFNYLSAAFQSPKLFQDVRDHVRRCDVSTCCSVRIYLVCFCFSMLKAILSDIKNPQVPSTYLTKVINWPHFVFHFLFFNIIFILYSLSYILVEPLEQLTISCPHDFTIFVPQFPELPL